MEISGSMVSRLLVRSAFSTAGARAIAGVSRFPITEREAISWFVEMVAV